MTKNKGTSLYKLAAKRHENGEILIDVNKSSSLRSYAKLSNNPMVKLFHSLVYLCSHPLVILLVVIFLLIKGQFLFVLYYVVGLFVVIVLENYLMQKITVSSAMKNKSAFDELYRKGVIKIREIFDPYHSI
jgi:hypothetical protein